MASNKKAPRRGIGERAAGQRARNIAAPTVGQPLQFLLPVLKTARPGADLFTAVVAHGFGGASHV